MSRSFPNDGSHNYLSATVGTGLSTLADYSIVGLLNPATANRGAVMSLLSGSTNRAQIIIDGVTGTWFGANDFSGYSANPPVVGHWTVIGLTKAAGSAVFRWHFWDYTLAGTPAHADGSGTHPDPGAIDGVRLGDGDNGARGDIAVLAVWKRAISDGEFNSLATTALTAWAGLSPEALWADDLMADLTGHGHDVFATVGSVGIGSNPPGFNYSLTPPPVQAIRIAAGRPRARWATGMPGGRWRTHRAGQRWQTGAPHA